jgi:hypothetical protein
MLIVPERNLNGAYFEYCFLWASVMVIFARWKRLLSTQQAIRRGSFRNVRELVGQIDAYVAHYNAHKRPFVWTATADSIFDRLQRIRKTINGTQLGGTQGGTRADT